MPGDDYCNEIRPAIKSGATNYGTSTVETLNDYRGSRCPRCAWALYDGDLCQNKDCEFHGQSMGHHGFKLSNEEAGIYIMTYLKMATLLSVLFFVGCATEVRYPNGATALTMRSNATRVAFTGGGISFTADRIDNATPGYVNWAGATDWTAAATGGAFAIAAPGVNGATRAAVLLAPHVTPRYQKSAPRAPATVVAP